MDAVTRWFCLTRASVRWIVLAVSTLLLVMPALGARADAYMYFANDGTGSVARFDPSNGHGNWTSSRATRRGGREQHLHLLDKRRTFTIGRANLDGTNVDPNFIAGLWQCGGGQRQVHLLDEIGASRIIGRATHRRHGDRPDVHLQPHQRPAASRSTPRHIYWTNWGTTTTNATIGRANLAAKIVDPTYIPGRPGDGDYRRGRGRLLVRLLDEREAPAAKAGTISRANLGGEPELDSSSRPRPFGMAVDATHIYWRNVPARSDAPPAIGRANLDGSRRTRATSSLGPPGPSTAAPRDGRRRGARRLRRQQRDDRRHARVGPVARDERRRRDRRRRGDDSVSGCRETTSSVAAAATTRSVGRAATTRSGAAAARTSCGAGAARTAVAAGRAQTAGVTAERPAPRPDLPVEGRG